jgi:hypothetical protein
LAAHPEYLNDLQEEVTEVTRKFGWSKDGVARMIKLDSFMRESQRLNSLNSGTYFPAVRSTMFELNFVVLVILQRVVMKPEGITFSNGVTLPQGTTLAVPEGAIHRDSGAAHFKTIYTISN